MRPFRFAVHTWIAPTMSAWRERAHKAEDLGYSALFVTDHVGTQFGPLVAATVAAETTTTLHVGTLVLNNDFRNPVVLAKEIASLGLAAEGRVEVGFGAGWLPGDYSETGIGFDEASVRVRRLGESLNIMKTLWSTGSVTFAGDHYQTDEARCEPRPVSPPRVIVGGGSKGVLTLAAQTADIVGFYTSMAAGRPGGDVSGSPAIAAHFERCLSWVREAAGDRLESIELQIAPFVTMLVGSRRAAIRSATMLGFDGEAALDLPIVLIGSEDEICERLDERREKWGFSHVVVPSDSMETFAPIVARMAGR